MIKLEIKKTSFFFCGDVKLSKKSQPSVEVNLDNLDARTAKGLVRGIATGAIVCTEGYKDLLIKAQKIYEAEEVETLETVQPTEPTPIIVEVETKVSEVTEEVKEEKVEDKPVAAPKAKTSRSKANTETK